VGLSRDPFNAITLSSSAVGLSRDPFNAITLSSSAVGLSCHLFNTNWTQVGAKHGVQIR
jgi:hypothetical protein